MTVALVICAMQFGACTPGERGGAAIPVPPSRGGHALIVEPSNPVTLGRYFAAQRGWVVRQFDCLYRLWNRESGWDPTARNSASGAGGIPQALPASKMGPRWREARVQILWGLRYIKARYGSPCAALAHSDALNWY